MPSSAENSLDAKSSQNADHSLIRAIAWTGAAMWAAQTFSWVSTILVARLLTPADYGVFALATVYLGLVSLVSEFGVGSAIVVLRELSKTQIAELNTVSIIAGFLWFAVSCAVAYPLGLFFSSADLPPVIIVMSSAFVVTAFKVVPDSLMQQELRFKLLANLDGIKAFLQAVATVIAAFAGLRYWSLVVGYLASNVAAVILTLIFRRHYFAWPKLHALKPALKLSWNLVVMRACWYLYSNADFFIAGRVLGETQLGIYRLAWSISNIPVDKISVMVMRSSSAFFSSAQKDYGSLRRYVVGITEGLSLITIPVSIGLCLVAGEFTSVVLGDKWLDVALPLRLLCLYAAARSLTPLLTQILNVTGNSGFAAWTMVSTSIVLPVGFYVGSRWGLSGIAAAWVIMYPLSTIPLYWRSFKEIALPVRDYIRVLSPATGGTIFMAVLVLVARRSLPVGISNSLQLSLLVGFGIITYVTFILIFHRDRVQAFRQTISELRGAK